MSEKQLYAVLGVDPIASTSEITSAFRNLAKIYHPDKPTGDQEKFKEISFAYEILSDETRRKTYDLSGINGLRSAEQAKARKEYEKTHPNQVSNQGSNQGLFGQTFKIPPNNDIFNNLFSHFFNNGSNTNQKPTIEPESNPPIIQKLAINLKDVYCGSSKQITYHRNLICQNCYGKGYKPHCQPAMCQSCHGQGTINISKQPDNFLGPVIIDCTYCQSQGYLYDDRDLCDHCQGLKMIKNENSIEIAIKPGMNDKIKLKYENLGNEEPGKTPGDLIIEFSVDNHTNFEIDGHNLKIIQNISLIEAINGVSRDIQFLDGSLIRLMTDPGQIIQPGEIKIYKNNGLPIYNESSSEQKYGDLIVQFQVILPKKIPTNIKKTIVGLISPYT